MRNPLHVLKSLEEQSCNKEYRYERLYRNLYNPEFYLLAYNNIAKSQGSMTAGADGKTLDDMSMARIDKIIVRALAPSSKLGLEEWISKKVMLPGLNDLDVQHCYRAMDFLLESEEEIQTQGF